MRRILLFIGCFFSIAAVSAQGYAFGIKGGLTVGMQRWDESFQREPLFRYHAIIYTESLPEDEKFALLAQLGYHVKGSTMRTYRTVFEFPPGSGNFQTFPGTTVPFEFRNISLTLAGKRKYDFGIDKKAYYMLGIRGDYTLSTKLRPDFVDETSLYTRIYPFEEFVRKINYGATFGGGIEWMFSEYIGGLLEFTVNPDFSFQYKQPAIPNVRNPNPGFGSSTITIPERQIRNVTFELTLGFRFLHKIEYID